MLPLAHDALTSALDSIQLDDSIQRFPQDSSDMTAHTFRLLPEFPSFLGSRPLGIYAWKPTGACKKVSEIEVADVLNGLCAPCLPSKIEIPTLRRPTFFRSDLAPQLIPNDFPNVPGSIV